MNHTARDRAPLHRERLPISEAAEWLTLLRNPDVSPEDIQAFYEWLQCDPNRQTFDLVTRVWTRDDAMRQVRERINFELRDDDGYDGSIPVNEFVARRRAKASYERRGLFQRIRVAIRGSNLTVAAATMGVTILLAVGTISLAPHVTEQVEVHETGTAQHRDVRLADGSMISLGAKTSVSVRYATDKRTIVLDRGEALFTVAHDTGRPFVVVAGQGTVTALGTVFVVGRDDERVRVRVAEGTVRVAEQHTDFLSRALTAAALTEERTAAVLTQGDQISYAVNGRQLGNVEHTDTDVASAWREGLLRYHGEPLRYVIRDVNRYSRKQIAFGDRAAEELRFTGTLQRGEQDIDDWLQALEMVFPLEVVTTDSEHVLLRSSR